MEMLAVCVPAIVLGLILLWGLMKMGETFFEALLLASLIGIIVFTGLLGANRAHQISEEKKSNVTMVRPNQ